MPSEKQIQNELDDSVRKFCNDSEFKGMLTGYVLLTIHADVTKDDRNDMTRYGVSYLGGNMPMHAILGLLDYNLSRLRHLASVSDDSDD